MTTRRWARRALPLALAGAVLASARAAGAQGRAEDFEEMRREIEELRREGAERERRLRELERRLDAEAAPPAEEKKEDAAAALDRAIAALGDAASRPAGTDVASAKVGGANLRLMDVSFDVLLYGGGSTERDEGLQTLQAGGHDPKKRGFTFAQGELSLLGAVDPWFTAEAHVLFFLDPLEGETKVELEEAFARTTALPWGLQLKAGQYFTEIGRINPTHPHAWDFSDQPLVNNRLFGPDGLRSPGVRLSWLAPLPWYSELLGGLQNASGETVESFLANGEVFEERAVGGRPFADRDVRSMEDFLYALRWANSVDATDEVTVLAGVSGLLGPSNAGRDANAYVCGGDLTVKWHPRDAASQWPFVKWQSEIYQRIYEADGALFENDPLDPLDDLSVSRETFHDWGLYSQLLVGFAQGWVAGARYEYVSGSDDPTIALDEETGYASLIGRRDDPLRATRQRVSPLLAWHPSEFSRIRLQYNWDRAPFLESGEAHSVWLGLEFLIGAHPAHQY